MHLLRKGGMGISDRDITAPGADTPWIAVVGQWRRGRARVPIHYVQAVGLAGGRARVLSTFPRNPDEDVPAGIDALYDLDPLDPSVLDGAAALVIPGGGDIDPEWYGAERHPRTHNVSHRRDRFELTLLDSALKQDMPILAICHGMQLMNVYFGGKLEQHLADDPSRLNHDRDKPRAEPAHKLLVKQGCKLESILGTHNTNINSHHHQGLAGAAGPLAEVGWAEDHVLEAVESTDHSWVIGVQWHPEAMAPVDPIQMRIFAALVNAADAFMGAPEITAQSA